MSGRLKAARATFKASELVLMKWKPQIELARFDSMAVMPTPAHPILAMIRRRVRKYVDAQIRAALTSVR